MVKLNRAQREALFKLWQRDHEKYLAPRSYKDNRGRVLKVSSWQYRLFRKTVMPGPGCAMVPLWNMWIGIEPDGYTHT